jgi:uncharacterized protein with HEPN domain
MPRDILLHMLDEIGFIQTTTDQLTFDQFVHDETLKRAFVRSLEVIGEAAKKIPDDVRLRCPDVE